MKLTTLYLKHTLINFLMIAAFVLVPGIGFGQDEDVPPNPNDNGEDPGGVPFDGNMNMVFLAAGVLFAVIITVRQLRKKSSVIA